MVSLFFDAETFQHVQTEYKRTLPKQVADAPGKTNANADDTVKLTEEFSDFKVENGLMLPHNYKLTLSIETDQRLSVQDWEMNLKQFSFNQPIDSKEFALTK